MMELISLLWKKDSWIFGRCSFWWGLLRFIDWGRDSNGSKNYNLHSNDSAINFLKTFQTSPRGVTLSLHRVENSVRVFPWNIPTNNKSYSLTSNLLRINNVNLFLLRISSFFLYELRNFDGGTWSGKLEWFIGTLSTFTYCFIGLIDANKCSSNYSFTSEL